MDLLDWAVNLAQLDTSLSINPTQLCMMPRDIPAMSEKDPERPQPTDEEIEREIRSGRRFSISEAIGRSAGDLLKGASPVTRKQQAEFAVEEYLERHLSDPEGALAIVLLRNVTTSSTLLESYDEPLAALSRVVEALLESEERLERFVKRVDGEWGRIYSERPHFEQQGQPPDANDPYTRGSVRAALSALAESLQVPEAKTD
jgi:hypothetical protein